MGLLWKTIKSFNRKEKFTAIFFSAILIVSAYFLVVGNTFLGGDDLGENNYSEGLVGQISRINPVFTEFSDVDADISSLVFSGLVKYNPLTETFDEDLATHTLSEDKLVYTFTLKNDLNWQDGEELSADDIYFTYAEVIQNENFKNPILKSNFQGVKVEELNSRTVTFTLNTPNSFFYSELTTGILPKHILKGVPVDELDQNEFNKSPVGSGPYKVDGPYQANEDGTYSINLLASDIYYGPRSAVERIRFIAYPTLEELIANRSVWHGAARVRETLLNDIDTENMEIYPYSLPQYTALFFNTDSNILGKNKVRLGISKAVDKSEILRQISYTAQIDTPLLELNQENWVHTFDILAAQGALFDSSWKLAEGDIYRRNPEGETFSVRLVRRDFSQSNPTQEEVFSDSAAIIQSQLKDVGIEVKIETYDDEALSEIIQNRDYDMLLYGQSLGYNLDTFSYWHSSQVGESGLNLSNYQNPKADFLIESIRGTFDDNQKNEYMQSLAKVISEDVPAVFLYTPTYNYLVDSKITGVNVLNIRLPKDRFANIAQWLFN